MALVPARWSVVATDLHGVVLGEVTNADQLTTVVPLNRMPTCSFTIPLHHDLANSLIATDTLIKVYRWDHITPKPTLIFHGPTLSTEEVGDSDNQTVAVNAVGPLWRMTKRMLGTTNAGISFGAAGSLLEVTDIAKAVVDTINGYTVSGSHIGYTGVEVTQRIPNSPPNMTKVGPFNLKPAGELLSELAASVNGYDFIIDPVEPYSTGYSWPAIGNMRIVPIIGVNRPDMIFEYGSGQSNVVGYDRMVTRENLMTQGYITAPGWPDGTTQTLLVGKDDVQITARGLFEDQVSDGGVSDDTARTAMIGEQLYYRKNPREIINITNAVNARPWPFTDYQVGDTIRARATVHGNLRFDAMFRIWGITCAVDKNGNETVTLEIVMP